MRDDSLAGAGPSGPDLPAAAMAQEWRIPAGSELRRLSCGAADFATLLIELTEWSVRLAHPAAVNRLKQEPDKSDHTDAWHLANLLRVGYLPEVWLADEATRQLRRLHHQLLPKPQAS